MKLLVIVSFVLCLVQLSLQKPKIEGDCSNAKDYIAPYENGCYRIICDGSSYAVIIPCGLVKSDCEPNKTFNGMKFDHEKMYPECCVQIICK